MISWCQGGDEPGLLGPPTLLTEDLGGLFLQRAAVGRGPEPMLGGGIVGFILT